MNTWIKDWKWTYLPLAGAVLCPCGLIGNNPDRCACGNSYGFLNLTGMLGAVDPVERLARRLAEEFRCQHIRWLAADPCAYI
jgi:hypothetical protein